MPRREPILIGISGRRGSGKDTAYNIINRWCKENGFLSARRALADPLKWSFARIFFPDISLEDALIWCNKIKNSGTITANDVSISAREAFQHYGYESHRQIFGDNFWINQTIPLENWQEKFITNNKIPDLCVVTDVRFNDEAQRVKDLGGFIWHIERELDSVDEHTSEAGIDESFIDLVIVNGEFRSFINQVQALTEFLIDPTHTN